jgi:3-oxoacyl-[acyl-carrier protein] reductase
VPEENTMDVAESCVLITGGTRGLGRQFALDLARQGARVGVCSTHEPALRQLESEFDQERLSLWTHDADVSDPAEVEHLFERFVRDHGSIDALVNNAGITRDSLLVRQRADGALCKMSWDDWRRVIDVNLGGVFLCGREAASHMVDAGTHGVIVNISSVCRAGNIGQTAYSAAKAGVVAMTATWAKELARFGIRVVSIAPGYISTQMTDALRPDVREKIERSIPAGRMGACDEISHALRFVLQNEYVSGRVIEVDGGLRL